MSASPNAVQVDFADQVADYLCSNPHFFESYPALLEQISLPHLHGTHAVSLSERQLLALREKNEALEARLAKWLEFGNHNDEISARVHALALGMAACRNLSEMFAQAHRHLKEHFEVPYVSMRLWNIDTQDMAEFTTVSSACQSFVDALESPYCGSTHGLDVNAWFGDDADEIQSQALVPLRCEGITLGLLALGSPDPGRFADDMGDLFLTRIGELIGAACHRLAPAPGSEDSPEDAPSASVGS